MASPLIALDVPGGDHAPESSLKGALQAVDPSGRWKMDPARILLVGDEQTIRSWLAANGGDPGFRILHASQAIEMHESPAVALRAKPDSSIAKMMGAVKAGKAGAAVSMGNTGAVVGAATLVLGTLKGVLRPGIAVTMNFGGQPLTLLDMGALSQPKPEVMVQHGIMGAAFAKSALGIDNPRVGLLNIGEESSKGSDLSKATYPLLAAAKLQFVGNVEGNEVFRGKCDVLVTDGFTGNVLLKFCEDFAAQMLQMVVGESAKAGVQIPREALGAVKKRIDYSEYGGALLLGVDGIVLKGHGRSDHNAVSNALHAAQRALDARINDHIVGALAEVQSQAAQDATSA